MANLGALQLSDPFTQAERTDIRYFCGYPAFGEGSSGTQNWRFFQSFGLLEFRLTNLSPSEIQSVRQMVSELQGLRTDIFNSRGKLGIAQAAVFTRNSRETGDRWQLFNDWRRELCRLMGVPPGEGLHSSGGGRRVI